MQHEYGIYGGPDGDSIVEIMRRVRVPIIAVMHTVLTDPSAHQREILEEVARAASAVVVMTETARRRLIAGYSIDPAKLALVAHGAPTEWGSDDEAGPARTAPPGILTWGLLGPGKGIEWAIDALAVLGDLEVPPRYVIAGRTHPHVLEHEGEAYRDMLRSRAADLGIADRVSFDDRYLDRPALRELVRAAAVVVLPYDSLDQVTSGVLIEAVTARRPIVATAFPHAVDLLSGGAGTVVAHRDPQAIAGALRRILTEPGVATAMVAAAARVAPEFSWAAVAEQYRAIGRRLADEESAVVA